jgi:hypothetical protein
MGVVGDRLPSLAAVGRAPDAAVGGTDEHRIAAEQRIEQDRAHGACDGPGEAAVKIAAADRIERAEVWPRSERDKLLISLNLRKCIGRP